MSVIRNRNKRRKLIDKEREEGIETLVWSDSKSELESVLPEVSPVVGIRVRNTLGHNSERGEGKGVIEGWWVRLGTDDAALCHPSTTAQTEKQCYPAAV